MEEIATTVCPYCARLIRIPTNIEPVRGSMTTVSVECDMREVWGHIRWHRSLVGRLTHWLAAWR